MPNRVSTNPISKRPDGHIPFTCHLPRETYRKLKIHSFNTGRLMRDCTVEAFEQWIAKQPKVVMH